MTDDIIDSLCKSAIGGCTEAADLLKSVGIIYFKNGRWSRKPKDEKENIIDKIEDAARMFAESRLKTSRRVSNETMPVAERLEAEMRDLCMTQNDSAIEFKFLSPVDLLNYGTLPVEPSNIALENIIETLTKNNIHHVAILVNKAQPFTAISLAIQTTKEKTCKAIERQLLECGASVRWDNGPLIENWSWFECG